MMHKIITKDSSCTFYNEEYMETYHSVSGALEESFKKYVEPCRIKELARTGSISILDICFGFGYNSITAISVALQENPNCTITITALEKDANILEELQNITLPSELEQYYTQLKEQLKNKKRNITVGTVTIKLLVGDATKTIKIIAQKCDVVFLDPFSPKKNPELWTADFFIEVKKRMHMHARLATYSCARVVRDNLRSAGFIVKDGPIVGRRAPATIAFLE